MSSAIFPSSARDPLPKDFFPKPRSKQDHDQQGAAISSHKKSSPKKPRSLSDAPKPSLSPSPAIREGTRQSADTIFASPTTPKRPNLGNRGLSLQMPSDTFISASSLAASLPVSPNLEVAQPHGPAGPVLPRRSRGLDFARACTNLHHSTLAESSPDSSPTISGRGINIPRRIFGTAIVDSPSQLASGPWSMPQSDRALPPSSYGSIGMVDDSDDTESSSDEDMHKDGEHSVFTTPLVSKLPSNFISGPANSPGGDWMSNQMRSAGRALSFRRSRLRKGHSGPSGPSSSSGNSSKPSPAPSSPPMRSVENSNYFQQGLTHAEVQSRRESLSLGTGDLHLWDSADEDSKPDSNNTSNSPRGVIRRPVTRRSNLLPKTKTFARIRAALLEEAAPVENEARREADVIHQVRESDPIPTPRRSYSLPLQMPVPDHPISLPANFGQHAEKNSEGTRFWETFENRQQHQTPPLHQPRHSSSAMSVDTNPDQANSQLSNASVGIGIFTGLGLSHQATDSRSNSRSRGSTPHGAAPTAGEAARNANNRKRGRDDDLDPQSLKRRAVSPGMSVHSSPVLPQSPGFGGDKTWGQMRNNAKPGERSNSGGSSKRVGLQGMTDTNDGLMNMSIE